jgi:serine protease Do
VRLVTSAGDAAPLRSAGLGFVVDPSGYVMTSLHLVQGARSVEVELPGGRRLPVKQIGRDPFFGVAILKVDAEALPHVALGESEALEVGEPVVAIGSPQEREAQTFLRVLSTDGATGAYLATNATIPDEAVGGPVVDREGRAVGIATTASTPQSDGRGGSAGRVVPIDRAKPILLELRRISAPRPLQGSIEDARTASASLLGAWWSRPRGVDAAPR